MRLILHLASPPTEKLLLAPNVEACKQAFMGQLKEADFIRWGSTKRMTGLRKVDQDAIWEGIKERKFSSTHSLSPYQRSHPCPTDNFDEYWRVASKVTPTVTPAPQSPPPPSSAASADQAASFDRESAYSVRSVPVRIYLPNGPVIQELAPALLEDGKPISPTGILISMY